MKTILTFSLGVLLCGAAWLVLGNGSFRSWPDRAEAQQQLCFPLPSDSRIDLEQAAQSFNTRTDQKLSVEDFAREWVRFGVTQELTERLKSNWSGPAEPPKPQPTGAQKK